MYRWYVGMDRSGYLPEAKTKKKSSTYNTKRIFFVLFFHLQEFITTQKKSIVANNNLWVKEGGPTSHMWIENRWVSFFLSFAIGLNNNTKINIIPPKKITKAIRARKNIKRELSFAPLWHERCNNEVTGEGLVWGLPACLVVNDQKKVQYLLGKKRCDVMYIIEPTQALLFHLRNYWEIVWSKLVSWLQQDIICNFLQ